MINVSLNDPISERGVMFYSNNLTTPAKGARKLVHGGSGISGHGDSYGPGSMSCQKFLCSVAID